MSLGVRGEVGGFGIGSASELTWSVVGGLGYKLSDRWTLKMGYRVYDIDYERGRGLSRIGMDMRMHGPWLGLTYGF